MADARGSARTPRHLQAEIEAAARSSSGTLFAPEALAEAGVLLDSLYEAGEKHGVRSAEWALLGADLPSAVLRAVASVYRRTRPGTSRELLHVALAAAGIAPVAELRGRAVLPRLPGTPAWGWSGEAPLTVGCDRDGWTLELGQARSPALDVVARSEAGVAALCADVLTGRLPDPFPA